MVSRAGRDKIKQPLGSLLRGRVGRLVSGFRDPGPGLGARAPRAELGARTQCPGPGSGLGARGLGPGPDVGLGDC